MLSKRIYKKARRELRHKFMRRWAKFHMVHSVTGLRYGSAYFYARMAWDKEQAATR